MKLHCKLPIHNTTIYETSCVKHNNDNIPKYTLQVASRLNQANGRLESIDWMSLPENNLSHFIFDAIQVIRFSTVRCVISWISPFIVNREPFSFVPWYRSIVDVSIFGVNLLQKKIQKFNSIQETIVESIAKDYRKKLNREPDLSLVKVKWKKRATDEAIHWSADFNFIVGLGEYMHMGP